MSKFISQDTPFFDDTNGAVLSLGKIYFGEPNTDPTDQVSNAKAPYTDRTLLTATDSLITLTTAGKLPNRLYLSGAYSITITDSADNVIDANPYYVGESTDLITDDSNYGGASLTATLDNIKTQLDALAGLDLTSIYSNIWRVGSLYLTTVNENPGSALGFGSWVAHAAGRAIVGVGQGTDSNAEAVAYTAGQEVGEYNHTLTEAELAGHTHELFAAAIQAAGDPGLTAAADYVAREFDKSGNNDQYIMKKSDSAPTVGASSSVGSGNGHNNVQPSIAVYVWRRTA